MPLLVSYNCGIPEAKDMSAVCHGVAVKTPCVRSTITEEDNVGGEMVCGRSVKEAKMIGSCFLETPTKNTEIVEDVNEAGQKEETDCGEETLGKNSLSTWSSFLNTFLKLRRVQRVTFHLVFTFEPLHNLHH